MMFQEHRPNVYQLMLQTEQDGPAKVLPAYLLGFGW